MSKSTLFDSSHNMKVTHVIQLKGALVAERSSAIGRYNGMKCLESILKLGNRLFLCLKRKKQTITVLYDVKT